MKAVVLVGGEGTRLRPLTFTRPKQMLPVGRRPMIELVVEWLAGHGIDEAVLSLGYRPDAFLRAYPRGTVAGVRLVYAVEDEPLDTAGAVRFAAGQGGLDGAFVVVNGDVITDLDVTALIDFHRTREAEATIALTPVEDPSRFGVVPTDAAGKVLAFIEKPRREEAPTNLINAGTYVLEPSVLARIPDGRPVSIERETFPHIVADGRLYAMASDALWIDAGTPATYLSANLDHTAPPDASCRVGDDAIVKDSVIGHGVEIAVGARVEGSVVMDGASVEQGSEVLNSLVGSGALIGPGARLSSLCVIGDGYRVGGGSVLSGQRLPAPPVSGG
jgi:mannose-1-phosphate guanylyltransferase